MTDSLGDLVIADVAWCIEHQATITWAGKGRGALATVKLPDGNKQTAFSWRTCVEVLRRTELIDNKRVTQV